MTDYAADMNILQAVLICQKYVHVRGVIRHGALAPVVAVDRMRHAALRPHGDLRLIHALQEHDQEGHVICQRQPRERAVPGLERAAQPAVTALVAVKFFRSQ